VGGAERVACDARSQLVDGGATEVTLEERRAALPSRLRCTTPSMNEI
jgi:hypothetical protein